MAERKKMKYSEMGDDHPKAEAVKKALAGQGEMPGGLSINWGRGAKLWLMDREDAEEWERERAAAGADIAVTTVPVDTDFDADART